MKRLLKVVAAIAGVRKDPERKIGVRFSARFVFLVLLLVGLVVLAGAAKYSESPQFCNSCHIMEPYYQAWETSAHEFVPCVDCHYPPGSKRTLLWKKFQALSQVAKYVTRTYSSRPFAEIEDTSCLRSGCHSERLLEGELVTPTGVRFDHRPHLLETRRGRQLRCVSCHSQIVVGRHVEVTYDTCYLCHFRDQQKAGRPDPLGGCLACHKLPPQDFRLGTMTYNHEDFVTKRGISCQNCHLDVVTGAGHAPQDRCLTCHNQPEHLAQYADIPFIHENHVTERNVACFHCHDEMRHGAHAGNEHYLPSPGEAAPATAEGELPGSHPPTLTFDCGLCHQAKHSGQLVMYSGQAEGLGLPDLPSPMYLAEVDCIGCHYAEDGDPRKEFRGFTFEASHEACTRCHGPEFNGIWEDTRDELEVTLGRLAGKLRSIRTTLDGGGEPSSAGGALARAERLHRFVRDSRGEHNVYLASVALREEDDILSSLGRAAGVELPDISDLPLLSGSYCASMCHERVGAKVPPESVEVEEYGATMPHGMHLEMIEGGCIGCHEIAAHHQAPLREGVFDEVCSGCH